MKYTSLELSKKLKENGCELEPSTYWQKKILGYPRQESASSAMNLVYNSPYIYWEWYELDNWDFCTCRDKYPAYDILNDICVKYAQEFFGENEYIINEANKTVIDYIFSHVRLW